MKEKNYQEGRMEKKKEKSTYSLSSSFISDFNKSKEKNKKK